MIIAVFVAVGLIFNLVVILLIRQRRKVNEIRLDACRHLGNHGEQSSRVLQELLRVSGYKFSLVTFHAVMKTLVDSRQVKSRTQLFCVTDGKPHPPYDCGQGYLPIVFFRLADALPKRQANQK